MNKEQFLKELNKNLKYLNNTNRHNELEAYNNLDNYDLDPVIEANKIYEKYHAKFKILPKISLFNSINIFINNIKNHQNIKEIILLLIIIIKVPFIYVRDVITNFFSLSFTNNLQIIWNISFEIIYAITTILIIIKQIKRKAIKLKEKA